MAPTKLDGRPNPDAGRSLIDELREDRREAERLLERIKEHDLHPWKGESDEHFERRQKRHRARRARARDIRDGYDARIEDARERRQERRENKQAERNPYDRHGGGIVAFDDTVDGVVEWIAWELTEARHAGWGGRAFSGWRSPEKSEGICYAMCGAPSCPGRCAGRSSKHSEKGDGGGAVDLTDPAGFEEIAYRRGLRLHNDLPADLPHMSATGH